VRDAVQALREDGQRGVSRGFGDQAANRCLQPGFILEGVERRGLNLTHCFPQPGDLRVRQVAQRQLHGPQLQHLLGFEQVLDADVRELEVGGERLNRGPMSRLLHRQPAAIAAAHRGHAVALELAHGFAERRPRNAVPFGQRGFVADQMPHFPTALGNVALDAFGQEDRHFLLGDRRLCGGCSL
jgi:hypothetical protein